MDYCNAFHAAQSQFHFNLFKETALAKANESFVYSPIGISLALITALLGANTDAKRETRTKMLMENFEDHEITYCSRIIFGALVFINRKNFVLSNKIFIQNNYELKKSYFYKINDLVEVQKINFFDKEKAAEEINNFVANKTNNNILNAIDPSSINSNTQLMFLNTINFDYYWINEFSSSYIKKKQFFLDNKLTTELDIMEKESDFKLVETDKFQILLLPYTESPLDWSFPHYNESKLKIKFPNLRMYIILPKETISLNDFIKSLTYEKFNEMIDSVNNETADNSQILLPKFNTTNNLDVSEILKKVGIKKLFENGMTEMVNNSSLNIFKIMQKTLIKVSESGTKVSAVATMDVHFLMGGPPKQFNANHPFMYVIADKYKNIFFNGVFRGT